MESGRKRMDQEYKNNRKPGFKTGLFVGILCAVLLLSSLWGAVHLADYLFASGSITQSGTQVKVDKKLKTLSALVDKYYLYEDDVDNDALAEGIYKGYAEALGDKYTVYYDEEETTKLMESTSGEFSGIGVVVSQNVDTKEVLVLNVYKDSPAEEAGMLAGDVIVGVDGTDVSGEDLNTIVARIRGESGTSVQVTVRRDTEDIDLTAVRRTIEAQTIDYKMLDHQIGYIIVSEFNTATYHQFKEALEDLETQGMEKLIIDLRGNPGGNVDTVTDMLRLLLPEGVIMSTRDKNGKGEEYLCDGSHEFTKPLAVLVNENSASAAEIFSGAVQDYKIGTIVGKTTYGKGVMQTVINLQDGTSVKITVAEYYLPSGRSINGTGVVPDVEAEYEYDENHPDADSQLEKAIEVLEK